MGKGDSSGRGKKPLQSRPGRAHEESKDDYDSDKLEKEFQGFSINDEPLTKGTRFRSRSRALEVSIQFTFLDHAHSLVRRLNLLKIPIKKRSPNGFMRIVQ
jgi:hypothetical protein